MFRNRTITPLPYLVYYATTLLISLIGLITSMYLAVSHYRVYTDMGYKSFCAISKAINCDTVSQSAYSIFLNVPVPIWGVIGYLFVITMLIFPLRSKTDHERFWSLMFWIALAYSGYSVVLALISTYLIRSYCIMCIVAYGVNLALLWYSWLIRNRFSSCSILKDTLKDIALIKQGVSRNLLYFSPFPILIALALGYFPTYWNFEPPPISSQIATGMTEDGHPWIGAQNPSLEIIEFADYECFQCKKMHYFLRRLISENPEKIRLVHRHYPMDHQFNPIVKEPFHVGSGQLALLAIYAAGKDKFWEMNDLLYELAGKNKFFSLRKISEKTGLVLSELQRALSDDAIRKQLNLDIKRGIELGVTGTPGYVIDGKLYIGQIPPHILKSALQ